MKNCYDDDDGWLMDDACSCIHVHMAKFLYDTVGSVAVVAAQCEISDLVRNLDRLSLQLMMADPMSSLLSNLFPIDPITIKLQITK